MAIFLDFTSNKELNCVEKKNCDKIRHEAMI